MPLSFCREDKVQTHSSRLADEQIGALCKSIDFLVSLSSSTEKRKWAWVRHWISELYLTFLSHISTFADSGVLGVSTHHMSHRLWDL